MIFFFCVSCSCGKAFLEMDLGFQIHSDKYRIIFVGAGAFAIIVGVCLVKRACDRAVRTGKDSGK